MPRPIRKNYERHEALRAFSGKGYWFTGRYQHVENSPWVTLTEIRLAEGPTAHHLLVGHINIKRNLAASHFLFDATHHHKIFVFYATYGTYKTGALTRGTLVLAQPENGPAVEAR